jgi:hypothetical protein
MLRLPIHLGVLPMRRFSLVLAAFVGFLSLGGGIANAESQTVNGTGDISRMVADNGTNAVTTKVFGLGRPCGGAWYLHVDVTNRRGRLLYRAEGGCTSGEWHTGLYYTSTGVIEDATSVRCRNFSFTRIRATGAYRVGMPRTCLDHAPGGIKVRADGANYGTMTGGTAGPTALLTRG